MNIFMKKGFMKKMAIVCLFLVVFNFVGTNVVYAKAADGWGGKLMSVFMEFIVGAADGVYNITNGLIMGDELFEIHGIIPLDTNKKTINSTWDKIKNIAGFVIGWATGVNLIVGTAKFLGCVLGPTQEERILGQTYTEPGEDGKQVVFTLYDKDDLPSVIYLPIFNLDLASMFSGKILLFDVNFFEDKEIKEQIYEGKKIYYYTDRDPKKGQNDEYDPSYDGNYITSSQSSSKILRGVVSSWYYRLRNLAVAISMIVLLYIGIRILLSSVNPESKAKYKTMLVDWLISICLIFFMHYIMIFSVKIVDYAINFISSSVSEAGKYWVAFQVKGDNMRENIKYYGLEGNLNSDNNQLGEALYYSTNMFGYIRIKSQFTNGFAYVGYACLYVICVGFICFFTFTYLRRVLYMAFLTIISPLVALTYPIDKINDGKAQAFNMWFKEYIFNLLIQPLHLLLYYILISSAFELASSNFIYAVVAICFMIPAEKLVRQFFGFEKAKTPGLLSGAGGTALAMSGIHALERFGKGDKGPGGPHKSSSESSSSDKQGGGYNFKPTSSYADVADAAKDDSMPDTPDTQDAQGQTEKDPYEDYRKYNMTEEQMEEARAEMIKPGDAEWNQYAHSHNIKEKPPESPSTPNQNTSTTDDTSEDSDTGHTQTPTQTPDNSYGDSIYSSNKEKKATYGKVRAAGRVLKRRALSNPRKFLKPIKMVSRGAAKVLAMGTLGTGAGILGAMTGDPNAAFKNMIAGATAGNLISNRIGNPVEMIEKGWDKGNSFMDDVAKETNDKNIINQREFNKYKKDKEIRKIYEQKLGLKNNKEIDAAMEKAFEYKKQGVSDDKIIASAMKQKGLGTDAADKKRILAASIAEKTHGSTTVLNEHLDALKTNKGYSNAQIKQLRKAIADMDGSVA